MGKRIKNFCKITILSAPGFFLLHICVLLIFTFAQLGMNYSFKLATDQILIAQDTHIVTSSVILPILLFFLMICIGGNTGNFNNMMAAMLTNKSKKLFYNYFMYRSYKEKQDKFYDSKFYDIYAFTKEHIESTTDISITIFNRLVGAVISLIAFGATISFLSPLLLIFIIILSFTIALINKSVVKQKVKLNEDSIKEERKVSYYSELLSDRAHAKELRIFRLKDKILRLWKTSYQEYAAAKYSFQKRALLLNTIPKFLEEVLYVPLILYFLYQVSIDKVSIGEFGFLVSITLSVIESIENIVTILSKELTENYKYIEKYEQFTGAVNKTSIKTLQKEKQKGIKIEEQEQKKIQKRKQEQKKEEQKEAEQRKLELKQKYKNEELKTQKEKNLGKGEFKELSFVNVSYRYPNQKENAVNSLSFTIKKGETVSILGYNGSGKSTMSKLMCGILQDYNGKILLNQKEIKEIEQEELFKYFGIGFQDFTKYSVTLRENIGFGNIEKIEEEEEIKKAAEKGNLQEIITRLPQGIDTILGKEYDKEGQDLSGGQWQRIILARAYMGEPEVLILDEPTASIDPIEEIRLLGQFKQILNEKTAVLISHRIGFARLSDRICIMENGRIIEDGSHDELIKLRGRYYELFKAQQNLYEESNL